MTPEEARRAFKQIDEIIFAEGKAWIPVEITSRDRGFSKAWKDGATFVLLTIFLLFRPAGLLGRRTRVEAEA